MKFNFTSQICTTKEQSERLLALGLKKGTADCLLAKNPFYVNEYIVLPLLDDCSNLGDGIPAWSLHRLIAIMPSFIDVDEKPFYLESKISQGKRVSYESVIDDSMDFVWGHGNLYDSIISCIGQLIKEGHFNKEYLEE